MFVFAFCSKNIAIKLGFSYLKRACHISELLVESERISKALLGERELEGKDRKMICVFGLVIPPLQIYLFSIEVLKRD